MILTCHVCSCNTCNLRKFGAYIWDTYAIQQTEGQELENVSESCDVFFVTGWRMTITRRVPHLKKTTTKNWRVPKTMNGKFLYS